MAERVRILIHTRLTASTIAHELGRADYSYYFVAASMAPLLERIGPVTWLDSPDDAAPIVAEAAASGEDCVALVFAPPHRAHADWPCRALIVLAWEFDTIPTEAWDDDERNDWRTVLRRVSGVITLSEYARRAVLAAMGPDYPVHAIMAPVFDRMNVTRPRRRALDETVRLTVRGRIFDTRVMDPRPENALPGRMLPVHLALLSAQDEGLFEPDPDPEPAEPEVGTEPGTADVVEREPEAEVAAMAGSGLEDGGPWAADDRKPDVTDDAGPAVTRDIGEEEACIPGPLPARRPGLKYRIGMTKHHAVAWYRDVLRDVMPRPVTWGLSRLGRAAARARYAASPRPVTVASEPVVPSVDGPAETLTTALAEEMPARRPEPRRSVIVGGVIYTLVVGPRDGRKNWDKILTAFCWALRDREDATLVLKFTTVEDDDYTWWLHEMLNQLSPFRCRVISLRGFLDAAAMERLIDSTTYYVNASHCEGQALPLMEFMARGVPAIAPDHTAMAEYINATHTFVVTSSREPAIWPHDTRALFRTWAHRVNWNSIEVGFRESYVIAAQRPAEYARRAGKAAAAIATVSSDAVLLPRLRAALMQAGVEDTDQAAERIAA